MVSVEPCPAQRVPKDQRSAATARPSSNLLSYPPAPVYPGPISLRILIDGTILKPGLGGIGTYVVGLVTALAEHPDVGVCVATSETQSFAHLQDIETVAPSFATHTLSARMFWRERHLPRLLASKESDVLLAPVPELPIRRSSVPSVVVVQDVSQVIAPALYGWPKWIRYSVGLAYTCRQADAVVSTSHSTLLGLRYTVGGLDWETVHVIPMGPQQLPVAAGVQAQDGAPYLLYAGSLLPHKNIDTVLRALAGGGAASQLALRLVGPISSVERERLFTAVRHLGLDQRVRHLGFVSEDALASLYEGALAVVLPSLIEGFGLTVLEAMSKGVPVVASDLPAVREVGGEAAVLVSRPLDPNAWADAFKLVAGDSELRAELGIKGRQNSERYSWTEVAQEFVALLTSVVSEGRRQRER